MSFQPVQLEPRGVQPLNSNISLAPQSLASKRVSLHAVDSLASMQGNAPADASKDAPKTTEESRGFCGTLYDVVTWPFRKIWQGVVAVWTFIWCCGEDKKAEEAQKKEGADKADKKDAASRNLLDNDWAKVALEGGRDWRKDFDAQKAEGAFRALPRGERESSEFFLKYVAGMNPGYKDVEDADLLEAVSPGVHRLAAQCRVAVEKLKQFHRDTENFNYDGITSAVERARQEKAGQAHFTNMTRGHKGNGHEGAYQLAQDRLVLATWIARGCAGADHAGMRKDAALRVGAEHDMITKHYDAPVHEVSRRLSEQDLLLVKKEDRKAFREFAKAVERWATSGEDAAKVQQNIQAHYNALKGRAEDAAKFVAFCISQREGVTHTGDDFVKSADPALVRQIVREIAEFDAITNERIG